MVMELSSINGFWYSVHSVLVEKLGSITVLYLNGFRIP